LEISKKWAKSLVYILAYCELIWDFAFCLSFVFSEDEEIIMALERRELQEKIFQGRKIYFSGSIRGVPHPDPDFFHSLISYMKENGALVLSEHVGIKNVEERNSLFVKLSGIDRSGELFDPASKIREANLLWLNEATHCIAVCDTASSGVGMEVQYALLKYRMGLNLTPVLCLVRADLFSDVSNMVKGISQKDSSVAFVRKYKDLKNAEEKIAVFLSC